MESYAVHVVKLSALGYLFACEPTLVAASELKLVAILLDMYRTHNRAELGQRYLTDATQLVVYLLLLGLKLLGFLRTCRSTTSPGTANGTNTTISLT